MHTLTQNSHPWSLHQHWHLSLWLAEFVDAIHNGSGISIVVVDCLSHDPITAVTFDVDYAQLAKDQLTCIDLLSALIIV